MEMSFVYSSITRKWQLCWSRCLSWRRSHFVSASLDKVRRRMSDESTLLDIVTRYVLPPILGGAGGLIVIWANWGIEKERSRIQARRALVTEWRDVIVPLLEGPQDLQEGIGKYPFMRTKQYSSLRQHLKKETVKELEGRAIKISLGDNYLKRVILEEIARIERDWGLV